MVKAKGFVLIFSPNIGEIGLAVGLCAGGRYNPATDSWKSVSSTNAPVSRAQHTGTWNGKELLVFGGNSNTDSGTTVLNSGARYNPDATPGWR